MSEEIIGKGVRRYRSDIEIQGSAGISLQTHAGSLLVDNVANITGPLGVGGGASVV